jgi:hypothetical protein
VPPLRPPTPTGAPTAPVVGVGGSQAQGGQAPTLNINNSVVNVGQQEVGTQGGPLGAPGTDAPKAPPAPGIPDLGPPPSELPDLTAMPDLSMPAPEPLGLGDPNTRPSVAPPTAAPAPLPAPSTPRIGPVWDPAAKQYRI